MTNFISNVKELGKVIRAVRIRAGLSQANAAALCGVSAPFLNGVERGKPTAQVGRVFDVCHALGIRVCLDPPVPKEELDAVPARKPRSRRR